VAEIRPARRRGPRQLAAAVARFRREATPPTLLGRVQDCWALAAGASIAEQASPASDRDGVITVHCRSAVWAAELTMLSEELLGELNRALAGGRQVRALRFTAGPR
jgi:predicted nucleic acid-binding Zn ribbon protein